MYLFLDTEFVPAAEGKPPQLLSIGLVTLDGHEFYAELPRPGDQQLSQFIEEHVLTQFGKEGVTATSMTQLACALARWLSSRGCGALQVCYDCCAPGIKPATLSKN